MTGISAPPTPAGSSGLGRNALCTARMRLIPSSARHLRADLKGAEALSHEVGAEVLDEWPPDLMAADREALVALLDDDPTSVGWYPWYWIAHDTPTPVLVGFGGFGGPPDDGRVDLAYSLVPGGQHRGYATEAAGALVAWAFGTGRVRGIDAETLPHLTASVNVLERIGFARTNPLNGTGVLHYTRDVHA